MHEKCSMGKVIFFHCSYIQCNILPINTQLTALYLCPVLLHAAITVYLARSKMQSNNVICSLPLIARIYLQIRGGFKYITFLNMGWVFSDNFWNFVFVDCPEPKPAGLCPLCLSSVPLFVTWQLYKMKQYTTISFYPNFLQRSVMTFAVWTYRKFSTPMWLPLRSLTISITSTPHRICDELIRDAAFGASR